MNEATRLSRHRKYSSNIRQPYLLVSIKSNRVQMSMSQRGYRTSFDPLPLDQRALISLEAKIKCPCSQVKINYEFHASYIKHCEPNPTTYVNMYVRVACVTAKTIRHHPKHLQDDRARVHSTAASAKQLRNASDLITPQRASTSDKERERETSD